MSDNMHMEVQEDEEDDDLDFYPILIGETPSEASSSLSSENGGTCDNVGEFIQSCLDGNLSASSSRLEEKIESYSPECVNEDEESVMQFDDASGNSVKQSQMSTCIEACKGEISALNRSDCVDDLSNKNVLYSASNEVNFNEPIVDENDDAICRRTRARHSLAHHTLEELEAFLQGSDDDDDDELHKVDEEEIYQKFLAAFGLGGDGNEQAGQGERTFDEDEDNDADFEIELEEALESDVEEATDRGTEHSGKKYGDAHVPETRQKKRLKEFAKSNKLLSGQSKAALRPILPYVSNPQRPPFPSFAWQMSSPGHFSDCSTSVSDNDIINGFTTCQIGQLYCLIHEHVQLLLQVFSLCVFDPSRQQVANDLQKLISEMIERHEIALSWRKIPYPSLCFQSSNLHSSQVDSSQSASFYWTPVIDSSSIFSILDVAPLRLAKNYLADIKEITLMHRQSSMEHSLAKSHSSKEPLFSLPVPDSLDNAGSNFICGSMEMVMNISPGLSGQLQVGQQQPKKSLAATLVESTMKQSIALVPADIAKLAERFLHFFNSTLFPHKPPTPAVANRVLFTDAEDGLLAMGIMEHNNDWLAIQQHFLPCKSTHQIFVRQKNRSSSKAPENPIKAVRRMKSSSLTESEKALIHEGLKIFKHDWLAVWRYFVPHRDPSMLPRQWRIATGTQKSYKKTEAVKEKRRLYEAKRRKLKACMADQDISEKELNNGDNSEGDMDCEDEATVHKYFVADLEAGSSKNMVHNHNGILSCNNNGYSQPIRLLQYSGSGAAVNCASISNDSGQSQLDAGTENVLLNSSKSLKDIRHLHQFSQIGYGESYCISSRKLSSCFISGTSGHLLTQTYRARKKKGLRIVKLAPDLPPVNLPPSVRVISQSAFRIYHGESLHSNVNNNLSKDHTSRVTHVAEAGVSVMNLIENKCYLSDNHQSNSHPDGTNLAARMRENASESDTELHHPLLFHNPSHFSFNCQNTAPTSYNFLLGSDCSISTANTVASDNSRQELSLPTVSSTIDFHPLLQRSENSSIVPVTVPSFDGLSADLRTPHEPGAQSLNGALCLSKCDGVNKLDLNVHLSSSMDTERTAEVCDNQNVELDPSTGEDRRANKVIQENAKPFDAEASRETDLLVQSTSSYSKDGIGQSHDIQRHQCLEDFHEESNPGIVMEQEELSDSEDDSGNVVFECEDLEDSEEEEFCGNPPTQIHNKVQSFSSKDDEIQLAQNLHQLQQSNSVVQPSAKRGKVCKGTVHLQHAKLVRSKNENGSNTKGNRSCRSSLLTFPASSTSSKKRKRGDNLILQDLFVGTAENKTAGSRRSKCKSSLD